ncbi:helix-turn-helix transcriptional regulator [Clostridium sporogenes]|uniref:helix-turn-helix domain-containing protein n=1 Tax=Clostridium sporogenes TaxID=1509 RepID=UPI0013D04A3D|nr:helix-turn-helix domain-containing protein [Clostridium sporogenes]NFM17921.1 helix-turn-helix transcriptional regulator [Clostridium sporogenes]
MNVSNKLRNLRNENNLTLKELSAKSGISVSFISDIENRRRNPSIETLKTLADALSVSVNDFFDDTNEAAKKDINIPQEYSDKYKVTSRDKKQYEEEMKKANEAFFMNDELSEEAKKEMLDLMSELFWKAKSLNKEKRKNSKDR